MPDNEEERRAAAGIPTPDSDKDAQWRRQVADIYSGVVEGDESEGAPKCHTGISISIGF